MTPSADARDPAATGHLVLFLHAHLPFVRDPEEENVLAEDWFFDAVTETYIPLLSITEGWLRNGLPARLTVSVSPPLLEMLRDELLVMRCVDRMRALVDLADSEVARTAGDERFRSTAELSRARLVGARNRFEQEYARDLTAAFAALQDRGMLELVTSYATHAFLPGFDASYARAQVSLGAKCCRHHLGRRPAGMWLPECGYRDIGHDLDSASLARFLLPGAGRRNPGLKYHRVTGRDVPLHAKEPYHRFRALEAAKEHPRQVVHERARRIDELWTRTGRAPVIVAPYDAEQFGHWWFEGPEFLDLAMRKSCAQSGYRLSTPSDVLDSGLELEVAMPAASPWGAYGYSQTWLNSDNEWIWPYVHHATRGMSRIARERPRAEGLTLRGLNQLARELVLATASDWPFMISMGTTVAYAESRVRTHTSTASTGCLGRLRTGRSTHTGCPGSKRPTTSFRTSPTTTLPGDSRAGTASLRLRRPGRAGGGAGGRQRSFAPRMTSNGGRPWR